MLGTYTTDCPWLVNNQVPIPLLANWRDPTRTCADSWVEQKLGQLVEELFGLIHTQQSVGNFPQWDIKFNNDLKIEIKLGSFNGDDKIFIETGKSFFNERNIVQRKTPSGLILSKAHYYLIIAPGKFGPDQKQVAKVRMLSTDKLRYLYSTTVETSIAKDGKNTYGFYLDIRDPNFQDGCLGHYDYDSDNKTINFSSFTKYRNEIVKIQKDLKI